MNLTKRLFLSFLVLLVSGSSFAQTSTASVGASSSGSAPANATAPGASLAITAEKQPKASSSTMLLGVKSYNSSGRFGYLQDDSKGLNKGQVYNGKQEYFIGYKFANDWGGFAQGSQSRLQYNDSDLNKWTNNDPSLTLLHPDWFDNGFLRLRGQLRYYIQYTDRSKSMNIQQVAYYFSQTFALRNGMELFNLVTPRYFGADFYSPTDTKFLLENRTILSKKLNSWCKIALGNWFQMEQHAGTPTGYSSEVIPQVDFLVSSNVSFGPRVSLPILSQNSVYDGPRNATLSEARGELFFQASL